MLISSMFPGILHNNYSLDCSKVRYLTLEGVGFDHSIVNTSRIVPAGKNIIIQIGKDRLFLANKFTGAYEDLSYVIKGVPHAIGASTSPFYDGRRIWGMVSQNTTQTECGTVTLWRYDLTTKRVSYMKLPDVIDSIGLTPTFPFATRGLQVFGFDGKNLVIMYPAYCSAYIVVPVSHEGDVPQKFVQSTIDFSNKSGTVSLLGDYASAHTPIVSCGDNHISTLNCGYHLKINSLTGEATRVKTSNTTLGFSPYPALALVGDTLSATSVPITGSMPAGVKMTLTRISFNDLSEFVAKLDIGAFEFAGVGYDATYLYIFHADGVNYVKVRRSDFVLTKETLSLGVPSGYSIDRLFVSDGNVVYFPLFRSGGVNQNCIKIGIIGETDRATLPVSYGNFVKAMVRYDGKYFTFRNNGLVETPNPSSIYSFKANAIESVGLLDTNIDTLRIDPKSRIEYDTFSEIVCSINPKVKAIIPDTAKLVLKRPDGYYSFNGVSWELIGTALDEIVVKDIIYTVGDLGTKVLQSISSEECSLIVDKSLTNVFVEVEPFRLIDTLPTKFDIITAPENADKIFAKLKTPKRLALHELTAPTLVGRHSGGSSPYVKLVGQPAKPFYDYKVVVDNPLTTVKDDFLITEEKDVIVDKDIVPVIPKRIMNNLNPYPISCIVRQLDKIIIETTSLILYNTVPYFVKAVFSNNQLNLTIGDDESDLVKFNVWLNGKQVYPYDVAETYTPLAPTPLNYGRLFRGKELKLGAKNTIVVNIEDEFGAKHSTSFEFLGDYVGLMFTDDKGIYYTADDGTILKKLDFGTIVGGTTTLPKPIYLCNKTGYDMTDVVMSLPEFIAEGVSPEMSLQYTPFTPIKEHAIQGNFVNGQKLPVFVRVVSEKKTYRGGDFDIRAKGNPKY